jgi:hypothetical protein
LIHTEGGGGRVKNFEKLVNKNAINSKIKDPVAILYRFSQKFEPPSLLDFQPCASFKTCFFVF